MDRMAVTSGRREGAENPSKHRGRPSTNLDPSQGEVEV
jgi:hypothetical protein